MNKMKIPVLNRISKLVAFDDSTSTQIAIVTVSNLDGFEVADYAQRLAEKWGIGQKGLDNGMLILIKPKTDNSRGQVSIAQGYGLEGAIPDITCGEIIDYEILPAIREGDYYGGLDRATTTLMQLASGEFSADEYGNQKKGDSGGFAPFLIILVVFIIIMFIRSNGGGFGGFGGGSFGGGGASAGKRVPRSAFNVARHKISSIDGTVIASPTK